MDEGRPDTGAALLERAIGYALCAVGPVTPSALRRPTPCSLWDLRALLWHANDSLAALYEGMAGGRVDPPARGPRTPEPERPGAPRARARALHEPDDPAAAFRMSAARLTGSCAGPDDRAVRLVSVDGMPLTAAALAHAGALEIAVHGWDVAQATGLPRPVPADLAIALLRAAPRLVPGPEVRRALFGAPLAVPADAAPGDRLVAFLGRDPYRESYQSPRWSVRGGEAAPEPGAPGRDSDRPGGDPGPAAPA